ncbi:efflux transporter outer membrane subunit [Vibrio mangrovi]|uniref:Efflux transporter outer membrane subunit n=1 Tax=Vibrio mangrovi TaxID=474394 RepID=A0A1Y6IT25_9VIBR|nr:efflux transporter outer membrane subunit [Vibrio mangrovi]MDW6004496.1 efflux transporter outer membrane subunit [Vibrio mangrovi]SMS00784.1 Multidrug resistance outer membrane protein MdtP precursor [Vibrio mangrovi]
MNKNKLCKTLGAVAVAALLSSCSAPSDEMRNSAASPEKLGYQQTLAEITKIDWPKDQWWKRYQDHQLDQLIGDALENSPDMQIAQARIKNYQGIAQQAGAIEKIQAGLNANVNESKASYHYQAANPPANWNDYASATLNFSYDFDFWGKNRSTVAASISDLAAAEAEHAAAKLTLSTSIAQAYAELARLYANQDTVSAAVKVRQKTVELLTKRYRSGLETKGAVSQAESAAASVEAELLGVRESIQLQKNALAALVGAGPDRSLSIKRPVVVLTDTFGLPRDLGVGLLGHRPDISVARWQAQAAAERISVAKAQYYPDINLSAFIGYQAFGLNNLTRTGNDAGSIGPAIYLPIFTGGRLDGQLTSAQANYEMAVARYNDALTRALHDVADAVTSTKALSARIDKSRQAVEAAREAHRIASNRYKGGLATYLDVLSAENALIANERTLVNLQSRAFSLDLALVHALGGGYQASRASSNI